MKIQFTKFTIFVLLGLSYFYSLSHLPLPLVVKNYLAIIPFQLLVFIYFSYQFLQRQRSQKPTQLDEID